jgi:hypothetical protein
MELIPSLVVAGRSTIGRLIMTFRISPLRFAFCSSRYMKKKQLDNAIEVKVIFVMKYDKYPKNNNHHKKNKNCKEEAEKQTKKTIQIYLKSNTMRNTFEDFLTI